MSVPETIARSLAAVYLVVGHLAVSHFIAARLCPAPSFLLRWVATFLVGMFLASLGFHVLATTFTFTLPGALVAMTALLAITFGPRWAREHHRVDRAREREVWRRLVAAWRRSPRRAWVGAFLVLSITTVLRPWIVPPLGWDTYVYHAMKAGLWVHEGGLAFLRGISSWACYRNYPAGGELFTAWGMLPFHGDLLAMAPEAVQWVGVILAAVALARELGLREPYASASAAAFATLPPLRLLVGSGYIEPGMCLCIAGGLAFVARYLRRGEKGALVLAAAAFGVATGFKITVLPFAAVALGIAGVRALWRKDRAVITALLLFLVAASPWYVYNAIDTGLPFSPFPLKLFGVKLGVASISTGIESLGQIVKPYLWSTEWPAFQKTFALASRQPEALGVQSTLPMIVFFLTVPWFIARRPLLGVMALLIVLANIAYLASRDAAPLRLLWPESTSRFWLPAYAVAIPVSLAWCARWPRAGRVWLSALLAICFYHLIRGVTSGHALYDDRAQLTVVAMLLVGYHALRLIPWRGPRAAAALVAAVALLTWLDGYRARRRYEAFEKSTAIHYSPTAWIPLAKAVDHPKKPYRIAITGGAMSTRESWFGYGFFGTRLQNELFYVSPTKDGAIVEDLKLLATVADRTAWLARIRASRADFVVAMNPDTVELPWLEGDPQNFQKVVNPKGRGVWRVLPQKPAATAEKASAGRPP